MKERSKEELEAIVQDFSSRMKVSEICSKYNLSERSFYRILKSHLGIEKPKNDGPIKKLEKKVRDQEKEIELLRAALKKY